MVLTLLHEDTHCNFLLARLPVTALPPASSIAAEFSPTAMMPVAVSGKTDEKGSFSNQEGMLFYTDLPACAQVVKV